MKEIYNLSPFSFVGGEKQTLRFNLMAHRNNPVPFDASGCIVNFSLLDYSKKHAPPIISKLCSIISNSFGDENIVVAELLPLETLTLSGKYIYQITIIDRTDNIEIPGKQGLIHITRNINQEFIRTYNIISESSIPEQIGELFYNGNEQSPIWEDYNTKKLIVSGITNAVNAGTYTAIFTPALGYEWTDGTSVDKSVVWSIGRATVINEPSQSNLLTYSGSSQSPIWINYSISQLTISGTTSGVNAGSYNATFTPTSNYKWQDGTITAKSFSWNIGRASVSQIPIQSGLLVYTGDALTPTWDGYDVNKLTIGGVTSSVDIGDYIAAFTPTSNYQWWDGSVFAKNAVWVINEEMYGMVPVQVGILVYNGSSQSPAWGGYDSSKLQISGTTSGINADTYTVTFTPINGYEWFDGMTDTREVTWVIGKAVINSVPVQSGLLFYNGFMQSPVWEGYDENKLTIGGITEAVEEGDFVTTFIPKPNYKWWDGTVEIKYVTWSINVEIPIPIPIQSGTLVYTGNSLSPTWNGYDSSKLIMSGTISGVNVGDYTATFTPKMNYQWWDGSVSAKDIVWVVERAIISTIPSQSGTLSYTCSSLSPTWSGYDSAKMTIGGTTNATNPGSYMVTFTPNSNYQWSDGSVTSKNINWSINKATGSLSIIPTSMIINNDNPSGTIMVTRSGDGVVSALSSNTGIATVSVSGTIITVNNVNQTNGSATITVSVGEGTNYSAPASQTCNVTVNYVFEPIAIFGGGGTQYSGSYPYYQVANVDYRTSNGTGSTGSALSVARYSLAAATAGDNAVFGGGTHNDGANQTQDDRFSTVDYRTSTGTGSTGTALSSARRNLSAASAGNNAVFGGGDGSTVFASSRLSR